MPDMKEINRQIIAEFRANAGKLSGRFGKMPMLLLTTIGAKSGEARTMPLAYSTDGDRVVIIASQGGAPTNPAWYHNILLNPEVTVEVGPDKYQARASVVESPERERLFDQQAELIPVFQEYKKITARIVPVVVLDRID
ncbi:MAG TPA: nitroreductase family deazaflavin-dependent oxidoreductase [Dehalococcoidia bacterium]|nr:nitroreductase family deazaflavin-dependent oxidoreductase [Dehalococcoidia bacterium]